MLCFLLMWQILYVESVHVLDGLVERSIPPLTAWTKVALKERVRVEIIAGGFGGGKELEKKINELAKSDKERDDADEEKNEVMWQQESVKEVIY